MLALELLDDSGVETKDLLGEDDDIFLFGHLNQTCDYFLGTILPYIPDEFKTSTGIENSKELGPTMNVSMLRNSDFPEF